METCLPVDLTCGGAGAAYEQGPGTSTGDLAKGKKQQEHAYHSSLVASVKVRAVRGHFVCLSKGINSLSLCDSFQLG